MSDLKNHFYKDNSANYDEFKIIETLFKGVTEVFDEVISQSIDNSNVTTMRAFTTIPVQIINVVDACYSLPTILANKEVLNITKIDPNLNIQERIDVWNGLNPKIKAAALDQLGLMLMLVNPDTFKGQQVYIDTFKVIDFELYDYNTGSRLIFGLDYYYEYNKIYFLRFGSQTNTYNNKRIVMKNIVIDNNNPEKILGESLDIYANSNFSPSEYRDIVTSFTGAALAGPVINKINQSFNPDTNLSSMASAYGIDEDNISKGIKVVDYKSADEIRKRFWSGKLDGIGGLNLFDFLVTIPSEYLYKAEKMEYVYNFIKKIKPAHSNFVLCPEYALKDILSLRYSNFSFKSEGEMTGIKDKIKYEEDNHKLVYLEHLTKIQSNKSQRTISDDLALDTNYFDIIFMLDEFKAGASHEFYEVAPKIKSTISKLDSFELISDKRSFEESLKKSSTLDLIEKVSQVDFIRKAPIQVTDVGIMIDAVHFHETDIAKITSGKVSEKLNSKESFGKFKTFGKINDNIRSAESDYKIVYLEHLTRVHPSRQSLHLTDEIQLDTDYFDSLLLGDTFKAYTETSTKDNISYKEHTKPVLLNGDSLCDKISSIEDPKASGHTNLGDSLRFASKANVIRCDSVYYCDCDEGEINFALDNNDDLSTDGNSVGYETISIKLIPKN